MLSFILIGLGLSLLGVIFLQVPKQESLGRAFAGVHKTRVEVILTRTTYVLFVLMVLVLIAMKYVS